MMEFKLAIELGGAHHDLSVAQLRRRDVVDLVDRAALRADVRHRHLERLDDVLPPLAAAGVVAAVGLAVLEACGRSGKGTSKSWSCRSRTRVVKSFATAATCATLKPPLYSLAAGR